MAFPFEPVPPAEPALPSEAAPAATPVQPLVQAEPEREPAFDAQPEAIGEAALELVAAVQPEFQPVAEPAFGAQPEVEGGAGAEAEPKPEAELEAAAAPERPLPTMRQLDELSADLDDVDAVLARMDAQRLTVPDDSPGTP